MRGVRAVKGRLVPDRNGMPVLEIDHDSLVKAAWELTMEHYFPEPKPPSVWQQFTAWLKTLRKPSTKQSAKRQK